ncbi:ATP-binding cassette domain-containing protein [Komagataeibacter sp. AV436]|uniref:ATP-binding cassette domain-containing protein n=1 Tax=Komagataeibacter melomenusus TaxID=2766578 RepID=A0ABX2AGS0_9PROT|nr:ATP-binding cassette domain-containing protein [Komagataeibacter melomenusus]MBV1832181.1 ATP-binding cassette domain-containing protein [Komagataeibacter melomenusus]NPC67528.1 ATP-binding cassette domain-containing protein [Komagataeibacter melomenusus]
MDVNVVDVRHVSRRFGGHVALDDVSFSVARGEILGVIGRSGAGKSSLLRCLGALDRPDAGQILIEGQDITTLPQAQLVSLRRRIGFVFQHFNLLGSRTVAGNISLPLEIAGVPRAQRPQRIAALLALVGLSEQGDKWPAQLSGGQKQRVGIARALANDPALLLCDEATSALDPETTTAILDLLAEINRELGLTIILITHEMDVIRRIATHLVVLDQGRIVENAPTLAIMGAATQSTVTQALLSETQPQVPPALRARLVAEPAPDGWAIIRIRLAGEAAWQPLLSQLGQQYGVEATVLQGGTTEIAGQPFADQIVSVTGYCAEIHDFLTQFDPSLKVLGHVPADH